MSKIGKRKWTDDVRVQKSGAIVGSTCKRIIKQRPQRGQ